MGIEPAKLLNIRLDALPTAMVVCKSWARLIRWTLGSIPFGLRWTGLTCEMRWFSNVNVLGCQIWTVISAHKRDLCRYMYMHIFSNSLFKKSIQYINGSNILWNSSFTEGKTALYKMTRDGLSCFENSWFSKFSRGGPRHPTSRPRNVIYFFDPTLQCKH